MFERGSGWVKRQIRRMTGFLWGGLLWPASKLGFGLGDAESLKADRLAVNSCVGCVWSSSVGVGWFGGLRSVSRYAVLLGWRLVGRFWKSLKDSGDGRKKKDNPQHTQKKKKKPGLEGQML